jgi:hypothetical protein
VWVTGSAEESQQLPPGPTVFVLSANEQAKFRITIPDVVLGLIGCESCPPQLTGVITTPLLK